jgi:hypothetical protein
MLAGYFARMGVDRGLLALVRTVKFEEMHILTREEIVRFGIDRREFVETPWRFEPGARSMVQKIVLQRNEGEKSFRTILWRVICFDRDRFELDLQRPAMPNPALSSVSVSGSGAPVPLSYSRARTPEVEFWGARMAKTSVQSLLDSRETDLIETSTAADGHKGLLTQKLSNEGLAESVGRLVATCPAPTAPAQQHRVEARDRVEK